MIRVVVVDDHPLFAQGTVEVLDRLPGIRAVGFALSLDQAESTISELKPDVILCDVMLGDQPNGFELVERLSATARRSGEASAHEQPPPIIFLSQFSNDVLHKRAMAAGAAGYLSKTVEPDALRAAVVAVAAGSTVFPRTAIAGQSDGPRSPSPRELDVLEMVADGRSNTEIGARLGIAESTVETHIARLRSRYGLTTRTQLALLADRQGWLGPRPNFAGEG